MYLLATVELSLPALLEQRDQTVVFSGSMLTCFAPLASMRSERQHPALAVLTDV